jgi:hypothetical protein
MFEHALGRSEGVAEPALARTADTAFLSEDGVTGAVEYANRWLLERATTLGGAAVMPLGLPAA